MDSQPAHNRHMEAVRKFLCMLGSRMTLCVQDVTESCNMGRHEFLAVRALALYGSMTVKELAGHTEGASLSTMTRVLDRLEAQGLAERRTDPGDRRSFLVVLTPEGEKLSERFMDSVGVLAEEMLERLSEQERAAFVDVAEKLSGGEACPLKRLFKSKS